MQPTGTALARDRAKSYFRFYCLRGHAHRSTQTMTKCDTAFCRKVKRDTEALRKRLGFDKEDA
jgi:hypothetical protein